MERKTLVNEVKEYFVDSDHWRRLCASLQDPDPWGTHIHAYAETSVHPDSLEKIMTEYFPIIPTAFRNDLFGPYKSSAGMPPELLAQDPLAIVSEDGVLFVDEGAGTLAVEGDGEQRIRVVGLDLHVLQTGVRGAPAALETFGERQRVAQAVGDVADPDLFEFAVLDGDDAAASRCRPRFSQSKPI